VVVAGANLLLSEQDILNAETLIASSKVLICQLEICSSVTFATLELAHRHGGPFMSLICSLMYKTADYISKFLRAIFTCIETDIIPGAARRRPTGLRPE